MSVRAKSTKNLLNLKNRHHFVHRHAKQGRKLLTHPPPKANIIYENKGKANLMEILQETVNSVAIIAPKGRLDVTTTPEIEKAFAQLFEQNREKILVDCTWLDYISSAGLRALLTAAKSAKKINGKIALSCLNKNVKQIFEISGFTSIFDIFDARDAGIKALEN